MASRAKGLIGLAMSVLLFAAIVAFVPTAAKAEEGDTTWQTDYKYSMDESNNEIVLTGYRGGAPGGDLVLPATATVMGKVYNTVIDHTDGNFIPKSFFEGHNITSFKVEQGVKAYSLRALFSECGELTSVDLSGLDTSDATDMSYMFYGCRGLTSINLSSGFNTSNVTDMSYMFDGCSGLTSLDVSNFDTSHVINMSCMFYWCSGLTSIDVSGFDTANVTNMGGIFGGCSGLTGIDLSSFDTANVTNMSGMFSGCSGFTSLDVSNLNTSKVTDMKGMFGDCSSLTGIDLSSFDTANVTNMGDMFSGCGGFTSLDISNFDTSSVMDMSCMFSNCSGLTSIDVSGLDTSRVTDMSGMFNGCSSLTSIDVRGIDTGNVKDMSNMFNHCSGLTSLDVSDFDTGNVTNMRYIFLHCENLKSLDISGFDTGNVTNMDYMFTNCESLESLDVRGIDTANVMTMDKMFAGCKSLKSLDVSGFNTANVISMRRMFSTCHSLTSLDVSGFYTGNVTDMSNMFTSCSGLTSLNLSRFDFVNVSEITDMLLSCISLKELFTPKTSEMMNSNLEIKLPNTMYIGDAAYDDLMKAPADSKLVTKNDGKDSGSDSGSDTKQDSSSESDKESDKSSDTDSDKEILKVAVTGINLDRSEASLEIGVTLKLSFSIEPNNATDKTVKWSSSQPAVASVEDGTVTALAEGSTNIVVTTNDGGYTAACTVTVIKPGEVLYTPDTVVAPAEVETKPAEKQVSVGGGETVPISIETSYTNAITYTGGKIKPEDLGVKVDTTDITKAVTLKEGVSADTQLLNVSYVSSNNKNAGKNATFYGKISITKAAKNAMDKKEYTKLQKLVKAANKQLKANKCKYTINPKSILECSPEVHAKLKDGVIKTKTSKGVLKLTGLKSVKLTIDGKKGKLKASMYAITEPNTETNEVKLVGKKNFTGTAIVTVTN